MEFIKASYKLATKNHTSYAIAKLARAIGELGILILWKTNKKKPSKMLQDFVLLPKKSHESTYQNPIQFSQSN